MATFLPPTVPFRYYNLENIYYTSNTAKVFIKFYLELNYNIGIAFTFVINPIISNDLYKDVSLVYFFEGRGNKFLIEIWFILKPIGI